MNQFTGKKVTVVGIARSGFAAAALLKKLGADVGVTDLKNEELQQTAGKQLRSSGINVELGGHTRAFFDGSEFLVVSPGVDPDAEPLKWAKEQGVRIVSEIELASCVCEGTIIATTGTNGKTTTTTLIAEVLKESGFKCRALGNIGTPFSGAALDIKKDEFVSLEVSSFQLENIESFHPKIALILNLTPDHLDRHKSMSGYLNIKKRIFMNQDESDYLILNFRDEMLKGAAQEAKSKVIFFNRAQDPDNFNQNQMAVLAVADVLKLDRSTTVRVLENFKGVEHRMEYVRTKEGVDFINDSKATNIDSSVWALNNIKKPAVLIAGGRDKGSDFTRIRDLIKQKVKFIVLVGESCDRMESAWKGIAPIKKCADYKDAVRLAYAKASSGDCVLLSPMAKSFDLFDNYEHRGRVFKEIVNSLT